ncbi:MAG: adenylate cyclase [Thermoplasmata archaeon]|jgi:two-component system response regulator FlrC|nr:adenylate cyclase [Thermoplasmata archaeon]
MASLAPLLQRTKAKPHVPVVLIVDDEPDVLESLADLIEQGFSYRAVTASSGPKALDILGKRPVDAVVSDYRMPVMDGCEFLREAKARHPGIPRLMLTAYPTPEVEDEACGDIGVRALLHKPVDPDRLGSELQAALADEA